MDVSVIIPTRNKEQELKRCLEAVLGQQFRGEFEVLVCDDGSTDGTPQMVRAWCRTALRLRYLTLPAPGLGPAAARNLGIRQAHAGLVAMTDDDTIPDVQWLEHLCAAVRPGVAGVEGRVTFGPPGEPPPGPCETAPVNETGGVYLTCNALYRREVLALVGGFDERFPFAAFEDCDLAARVLRHGAIAWAPDAVVIHPPRRIRWRTTTQRLRHLPWVMLTAKRYGYLGWPCFPTRHPRARTIWNALVALPIGRLQSALRAFRRHSAPALRACLRAVAEPWVALWIAVPELLRFDLESAAFLVDYLDLPARFLRVGVVIVNHRQPDQAIRCIRSFPPDTYPDLKWIVVENEAEPLQVEQLRRELPGVEWQVSHENLGYTGGNNLGIRRALELGCEYILIMNDDTECMAPDFIRRLVSFMELNPRAALAGPRVHFRRKGQVQNTVLHYPSLTRSLLNWFGFRLFPRHYHLSGDSVRQVEMLNGVCVMLRATAIRQVGAFDPRFFMYIEDADIGLRLRQAGWQLAYVPFDSIVHLQRETGYDLYGWASLLLRRNSVYFLQKHHRPGQAWAVATINMLLALLRSCATTSAKEFKRRLAFSRALWHELRAVLWTASWEERGSWRPSE